MSTIVTGAFQAVKDFVSDVIYACQGCPTRKETKEFLLVDELRFKFWGLNTCKREVTKPLTERQVTLSKIINKRVAAVAVLSATAVAVGGYYFGAVALKAVTDNLQFGIARGLTGISA